MVPREGGPMPAQGTTARDFSAPMDRASPVRPNRSPGEAGRLRVSHAPPAWGRGPGQKPCPGSPRRSRRRAQCLPGPSRLGSSVRPYRVPEDPHPNDKIITMMMIMIIFIIIYIHIYIAKHPMHRHVGSPGTADGDHEGRSPRSLRRPLSCDPIMQASPYRVNSLLRESSFRRFTYGNLVTTFPSSQ